MNHGNAMNSPIIHVLFVQSMNKAALLLQNWGVTHVTRDICLPIRLLIREGDGLKIKKQNQ